MKTLDRLVANNQRLQKWWSEGEDGYWVLLTPGWAFEGCHCIHEWTVKDILTDVRLIEPCDCEECVDY